MKKELEDLLNNIKSNPSSGVSHDAKMALVQVEEVFAVDKLTEEVVALKNNLTEYSEASKKESSLMRWSTGIMIIVAILNLFIATEQVNLSKEQNVSERISQKRSIQEAIELCKQNKDLKDSGLFEISTGRPASCEETLRAYEDNGSIWHRIKNLFKR